MAKLTSSLVISLTDRVSGPARGIMGTFRQLRGVTDGFNRGQMNMATGLMSNLKALAAAAAAYVSLTEGISGTIGAAIKFEDSMSDIRKVVDFKSPQQFKQMGADILKMSSELGMSTSSIAAIVAAWGQANAKPEELMALTELTAKVATAWDTTAAETGDALAKIRTSLGLTVEQTGLVADAINFLGNTSASGTKDLLKFTRGLNSGQIAGFAAKETLAFGAAMISAGFESEVAETSFRNMAFALTAGSKATKEQRSAFKRLGMDGKKVSKAMQKDAVGTTLAVLDAIKKLPKDEQGAIAASLFGKEARAIPALLNNLPELRRLLDGVAEDTNYAGSAQKEFDEAMKRTSQNLAKLKQTFAGIGISIGNMALPKINEWATELNKTLSTLDQRVTIFDELSTGMKGFMSGLGFDGGSVGEQFSKLYEGIFGSIGDFEKDTDNLGAIFAEFRDYGATVRDFGLSLSKAAGDVEKFFNLDAGTIGETLGTLGSNGFKLAAAAVGITLVAGALTKLARAMLFLTGVSTVIGGAKGIAKLFSALNGATAGGVVNAAAAGSKAAPLVKPGAIPLGTKLATEWDKMGRFAKGFAVVQTLSGLYDAVKNSTPEGQKERVNDARSIADTVTRFLFGDGIANQSFASKPVEGHALESSMGEGWAKLGAWLSLIDKTLSRTDPQVQSGISQQLTIQNSEFPGKTKDDFDTGRSPMAAVMPSWLDHIRSAVIGLQPQSALGDLDQTTTGSVTINGPVLTQPSGVQQVSLTNPPQPNVYNVSASVVVNEAANGAEVARQFASSIKTAIAGTHADMNHQAHA